MNSPRADVQVSTARLLFIFLLGRREALADALVVFGRYAEKDKAHLIGRLFAESDALGRAGRVERVLVAIVVMGDDIETRAGGNLYRLVEVIHLLPVVVPIANV